MTQSKLLNSKHIQISSTSLRMLVRKQISAGTLRCVKVIYIIKSYLETYWHTDKEKDKKSDYSPKNN